MTFRAEKSQVRKTESEEHVKERDNQKQQGPSPISLVRSFKMAEGQASWPRWTGTRKFHSFL